MPQLLVLNAGSSSLIYRLYDTEGGGLAVLAYGKAHRVGVVGNQPSFLEHRGPNGVSRRAELPLVDHSAAAIAVLDALITAGRQPALMGHRFVHGGERFTAPAWLTPAALADLEALAPLAPIHNPNSLAVVSACSARLPRARQYAAFDTAFHAGLPEAAATYALPLELRRRFGLRKYGFHGLSYQSAARKAPEFLGRPAAELKLVACHLGTGGSSACAIRDGRSVETSMGYSPLAGLVMSTRPGDLDPAIPLALLRGGLALEEVEHVFNHRCGLLGLSGVSTDLRDVHAAAEGGNPRARLAWEVYVHRLVLWIGALASALGGLDALAFTDDLGAGFPALRSAVCGRLGWLGVELDAQANKAALSTEAAALHAAGSRVAVVSLPADEEGEIARAGLKLTEEFTQMNTDEEGRDEHR